MSPCHSCDDGSGCRRSAEQMFGLRALPSMTRGAASPPPSPVARLALPHRSQTGNGCMEIRCSIPQRDCGRFSRPSLFSATKGWEKSRPDSKNYPQLNRVAGGVKLKSTHLDEWICCVRKKARMLPCFLAQINRDASSASTWRRSGRASTARSEPAGWCFAAPAWRTRP